LLFEALFAGLLGAKVKVREPLDILGTVAVAVRVYVISSSRLLPLPLLLLFIVAVYEVDVSEGGRRRDVMNGYCIGRRKNEMEMYEEREMRTRQPSEADTSEATVVPFAGYGR